MSNPADPETRQAEPLNACGGDHARPAAKLEWRRPTLTRIDARHARMAKSRPRGDALHLS